MRADLPVGARQLYHKGKLWPPYPRPTEEKQPFWHKYHTSHYWPLPYVCEDRAFVRNLSNMQIANGWVKRNTLYDYHFESDSHALNHAGRMQLERILEDTPYQHRTVWVQKPRDPVVRTLRVESVRAEAIALVGAEHMAPIEVRRTTLHGRPADEIVRIREAELTTMPLPRILYTPVTASGSP
jgi:predicted acyl esterase